MPNSSRLSVLCDKIIEAGWLAAIVLVPLFFDIYSSRVFEPDKITLLRSLALIMSAAWIVRAIEEFVAARSSGEATGGRRALFNGVGWRTPLILPTFVLVVVYILATLLSVAPLTSLLGSYQRLQGTYSTFSYIVIFFMIVTGMRQRRQLDRCVTAIVITSLPIAFYGILQRVDRDPLPWGGIVTERVAGNMGNAIFIGAYLIMAFFLTLGRVIEAFRTILTEEESRLSDILRASAYIFVGAVQLITFAFAGSRGPLLGWLPGMFVLGLVGLLLLRVTLHGRAAPSTMPQVAAPEATPPGDRSRDHSVAVIDVAKALVMSLVSGAAAVAAFALAYNAFPGVTRTELGAVAALIGGLVPLLVFAGVQRSAARWLWASWIFFVILGGVGLLEINFSDHPKMVELRQNGTFGTLGTLFESESGTGKVRTLIWEGAVQLIQAHEPITYPDGTSDPLNPLRPIIGYGPESMYVAYNRFYPPDLAHYEARNASPDRSHNETWDSWVITGGIGFVAEQFLFLSVFYFALKFIGWIPNRRAAIAFIAAMILGGALGAFGLLALKGVNFMGTGWPGGVTGGIVLYVILFALFHFRISRRVYAFVAAALITIAASAIYFATFTSANRWLEIGGVVLGGLIAFGVLYLVGRRVFDATAGQPIASSGHIFLIIALFGGILSHYLEISLAGIAIAATRTYFWTFAGLLVVAGLNWVPADDAEPAAAERPATPAPKAPPPNTPRPKKRKASPSIATRPEARPTVRQPAAGWAGPVLAAAMIGALVMITLGFNYINTPPLRADTPDSHPLCAPTSLPLSASQVIWDSLTRMPYKDDLARCQSSGVLLLYFIAWLFGGIVSLTELRRRNVITSGNWLPAASTYFGVSIGAAFVYWMLHAGHLLDVVNGLTAINTTPAASLSEYLSRFTNLAENMAGLLGWFYVALIAALIAIGLSLMGETRPRPARAASEWGLIGGGLALVVVPLLIVNFNFNPIRADIIYKQGAAYVAGNACNGAGNPQTGNPLSQCDVAIAHLKQALIHAPTEDFYMLSLGASYLNKSAGAPPASTEQPSLLVAGSTYDSIIALDADRTAYLNREDALQAARVTLEHAQQVNPLNTDHAANLARLHRRWADLAADTEERRLRLDQASHFYVQATALSPHNAQLWNEWAVVFFGEYTLARQVGDEAAAQQALQAAQARLDESLRLDRQFVDTYIYQYTLYAEQGRLEDAQAALTEALNLNPNDASTWARLTDQLLASGNITRAEQLTIEFLDRNPGFLDGWRKLARIQFSLGKAAEAIGAAQRAVELSVDDANHWEDQLVLAEMLRLAGNPAAALPFAQAAVDTAPLERQAEAQQVLDAIQAMLNGTQPTP